MRQLLILSGKGGTGKTTIAAAFIKIAEAKAYADCDVDAPNLHLARPQASPGRRTDFYGMDKAVIDPECCSGCGICYEHCRFGAIREEDDGYMVEPYACEGCGVCEVLCPTGAATLRPAIAGELRLYKNGTVFSTAKLHMGSGNSGKLVTSVKSQLREEAPDTALAIIDGSPGIGCPVIASLSGVDMVLIVAEPSLSGISDMERIIKTPQTFNLKIGVCINKFDTNLKASQRIETICKERNLSFVGKIPFDSAAIKANNQGLSIVDIECPASEAVTKVFLETLKILLN
ncbi:MAG: 4Fe-4S binding protein [Desulfitobacteriia bacterium]|jgi:MinD superfamily P-loop ATPase